MNYKSSKYFINIRINYYLQKNKEYFYLLASAISNLINALFSIIFLRISGQNNFSNLSPLLTIAAISAASSIGLQNVYANGSKMPLRFFSSRFRVIKVITFVTFFVIIIYVINYIFRVNSIANSTCAVFLVLTNYLYSIPIGKLIFQKKFSSIGLVLLTLSVFKLTIYLFTVGVSNSPVSLALFITTFTSATGLITLCLIAKSKKIIQTDQQENYSARRIYKGLLTALLLYLPYPLPALLVKIMYHSTLNNSFVIAGFIGSFIFYLTSPIVNTVIPYLNPINSAYIQRQLKLCVSFSILIAILSFNIAIIAQNSIFNLNSRLFIFIVFSYNVAAPIWAYVNFKIWIHVSLDSDFSINRYLLFGIVLYVCLLLVSNSTTIILLGPIITALPLFSMLLKTRLSS